VENISLILFSAGAVAYLVAAAAFAFYRKKLLDPGAAIVAATGFALWQATLAWNSVSALPEVVLLGIEILRPLLLLIYLHRSLTVASGAGLTRHAVIVTLSMSILIPVLIGFVHPWLFGSAGIDYFTMQRAWMGIFIAVGMLIALEQAFRNADAKFLLLRFACVAIAVTAVYDLYLFSDTLIFERLDTDHWRSRGGINAIGALFIALAIGRSRETEFISVSRNVVFYTASLTAAGVFLVLISVLGYVIGTYGGSWGAVLQLLLFFSALLLVGAMAVSERVRNRVRVYVAKNFFTLRYDYRREWLNLIDALSGKGADGEVLYVRAIRVLADLYKSPGGVMWLRHDDEFVPVAPCRMKLPLNCHEPVNSAFCAKLAEEWIFELRSSQHEKELPPLPDWLRILPELGIAIPLLVEDELIGFMALQHSIGFDSVTWEDLDILRTAARQVASYVARHQAAEQLAQARQFDTYNQLTAFIMHDLKNLIAQQELVVKNAAKHKENPAFVEDAIDTIQNSVARMSALLGKLQKREPSDKRQVDLQDVLMDALKKCESLKPAPALRIETRDIRVLSDRDHLVMIVSHIIKNAQEATRDNGFIDVRLSLSGDLAVIDIEDNGTGMDPEFVRQRLFKPFESTKAGKGMGIGAYQAREFLRSLGGDIRVMSKPGEGTTFTLTIPAAASGSPG